MKVTVYLVQHHNKIFDFEKGNLVAEYPTRNLNIGYRKTTVGATFFKEELQNGTCAQQLVSGTIAHCSTLPGHYSGSWYPYLQWGQMTKAGSPGRRPNEGGVKTRKVNGTNLQDCRDCQSPVARTRRGEAADRALKVQVPATRRATCNEWSLLPGYGVLTLDRNYSFWPSYSFSTRFLDFGFYFVHHYFQVIFLKLRP